jgi:hypothetical protein
MTKKFALIVTDASPLITLAIADALDLLLLPTLPVVIPDMVRYEVARNLAKPGAQQITSWIRDNEPTRVRVATTEVFDEFQIVLNSKPDARSSNRGELAASEVLAKELRGGTDVGILLFEDSDVRKDNFLVRIPDNVLILSTSEFLYGLESHRLIASAAEVLARATPTRGAQIGERRLKATAGAEDLARDFPVALTNVR